MNYHKNIIGGEHTVFEAPPNSTQNFPIAGDREKKI